MIYNIYSTFSINLQLDYKTNIIRLYLLHYYIYFKFIQNSIHLLQPLKFEKIYDITISFIIIIKRGIEKFEKYYLCKITTTNLLKFKLYLLVILFDLRLK